MSRGRADKGEVRRGRARAVVVGSMIGLVIGSVAGVAILTLGAGSSSTADSPGRGAPVVLPDGAAARVPVLDEGDALVLVNSTRAATEGAALQVSSCLTRAAQQTAAAFTDGTTPRSLFQILCDDPVAWSSAKWGWVSGADPTGQAQLRSAFARGDGGPSDLLSASATHVGMALDRQFDSSGRVTGFVLVWAVAE